MAYPTVEEVLKIHEGIVKKIGGSAGLRDARALEMSVQRPHAAFGNKEMYPTVFLKAAALLESLARNHPFVDGNKRTAFISALSLLQHSGYKTKFDQKDIEDSIVRFVVEKLSLDEIAAWLEENSKQE